MPKFNKSDGFQLRSGNSINRTSFFKGEARVTPPQGTAAYYKAPLKETVDEENDKEEKKEETTVETTTNDPKVTNTDNEEKENKEEDKEEVETQDTGVVNDGKQDNFWQAAGKILGNALIEGHDAVYNTKTKNLPNVEWRDKVKDEVETGDPEKKVDELMGNVDHSKGEKGPKTEAQLRKETLEKEKEKADALADKNNDGMPDYMLSPSSEDDKKVNVDINNVNQQGPDNKSNQT